jgi:hypothetical protein
MNRLLTMRDAATYCQNLPLTYFRNQIRLGTGPAYVRVSPKRIFFYVAALETWMATWEHRAPNKLSGI